ncbi:hypothetical protein [Streptomyces chrestomyceticus]|uniref:hypothetical protein n=1 Tax=Streptomyces chrestomyceticus TaxID=68185 RepID=UPI0033C5C968
MRRTTTAAAVALALLGLAAPDAGASATIHDGPVGFRVVGDDLHVKRASSTWTGSHHASARLMLVRRGRDHDSVTGWQRGRVHRAGGSAWTDVAWRLNRRFPDGSRLCVQWEARSYVCATIHD